MKQLQNRKTKKNEVKDMENFAFGIDLGGTTVKIGLFTEEGILEKRWEIPTRKEESGSKIIPDIADAINGEIALRGLKKEQIIGVGIDVPGPILVDHIVNRCANLGWGVVDVRAELQKLVEIDNIKVANDANAAALGEMWKGGGQGKENIVMITVGTGVGGGVIYNGQIISGAFGAAGEIGHLMVNKNETLSCGCGKKGHVEQYASATGIARLGREALAESDRPSLLRAFENPTAKDIFDCAKKDDELCLEIVDKVGEVLGIAAATISGVFDPEAFVIGGGVSKAGDILIDTIEKHFKKYAFHASEGAEFRLAALGNDAGMYGAVKMVL